MAKKGTKRINFDLDEDEWERLRRLRFGMRSHVFRAVIDAICDLWDQEGDHAMGDVADGLYELRLKEDK